MAAINDYPEVVALTGNERLVISQGGKTKSITLQELLAKIAAAIGQ